MPSERIIEAYLADVRIVVDHDEKLNNRVSAHATKDMQNGWLIWVNGSEALQRQRFSLVHELGHIALITNIVRTVYCTKRIAQKVLLYYLAEIEAAYPLSLLYSAKNAKDFLTSFVIHNSKAGHKNALIMLGLRTLLQEVGVLLRATITKSVKSIEQN